MVQSASVARRHAAQGVGTTDESAQPVTSEPIASDPAEAKPTGKRSRPTPSATQTSAESGSEPTESASAGTSQTSPNSGVPSKHWRRPANAKAFAAQANSVATMVLNGEIDLDVARVYSGIGRTMAQALSAEVYRARYMGEQPPSLSLEEDE